MENEKIKTILTSLLVVAFFLGYFILSAYSDYTWDEKQIEALGENWVLTKTFANTIDPIHFWTLFKNPVVRMGFIEKSSLKEVAENTYFVNQLWVDKNFDERATGEEFQYLLDCNKYISGWSKDGGNVGKDVNIDQIKWSDPKEGKYMTEDEIRESNKGECETVKKILEDHSRPE